MPKFMNTKHAILNRDGAVSRIVEELPQDDQLSEGDWVSELTADQVVVVEAGLALSPREFYFYEDGELLTKAQKVERLRDSSRAEPTDFDIPVAAASISAEAHIESQGYPAMRLVTLMDLESKLAQAGKTSPKLATVRSWLNTILGAFAANPEPRNDWPAAPFSFEEAVQEAVALAFS